MRRRTISSVISEEQDTATAAKKAKMTETEAITENYEEAMEVTEESVDHVTSADSPEGVNLELSMQDKRQNNTEYSLNDGDNDETDQGFHMGQWNVKVLKYRRAKLLDFIRGSYGKDQEEKSQNFSMNSSVYEKDEVSPPLSSSSFSSSSSLDSTNCEFENTEDGTALKREEKDQFQQLAIGSGENNCNLNELFQTN